MQTFWNIVGWAFMAPFILLFIALAVPVAIGIILFILAIILAVSIFAIPVLGSLLLLKKLV